MVSCKFARRFQGPSKVSCKFVRRQRRRLLVHADWNHARDGVASVILAGKLLATPSILTRIKVYNKRRRRFNLSKRFLTKDGVASILPRGARLATASQTSCRVAEMPNSAFQAPFSTERSINRLRLPRRLRPRIAREAFLPQSNEVGAVIAIVEDAPDGGGHTFRRQGVEIGTRLACYLGETARATQGDGALVGICLEDGEAKALVERGIDEDGGLAVELAQGCIADGILPDARRQPQFRDAFYFFLFKCFAHTEEVEVAPLGGQLAEGQEEAVEVLVAVAVAHEKEVFVGQRESGVVAPDGARAVIDNVDAFRRDGKEADDVALRMLADGDDARGVADGLGFPGFHQRGVSKVLGKKLVRHVVDGDDVGFLSEMRKEIRVIIRRMEDAEVPASESAERDRAVPTFLPAFEPFIRAFGEVEAGFAARLGVGVKIIVGRDGEGKLRAEGKVSSQFVEVAGDAAETLHFEGLIIV